MVKGHQILFIFWSLFFIFDGKICLAKSRYSGDEQSCSDNERVEYIDLSYSVNEETIFYPGQRQFELFKDHFGWDTKYDRWYSAFSFCMGEHGGTHLDSPYHFYKEGWGVEQIPMGHLVDVQGHVIDIEAKVKGSMTPAQYVLTVEDIIDHEFKSGKIPSHGVVFVYTGWSKYWADKEKYLGWDNSTVDENGQTAPKLDFPGVSEEASKWLFNERQIVGLGIDTPSVDQGRVLASPVHIFLAKNQVYNLENVANLHLILGRRCTFFVLPMKIVGGTGSPTRILAKCFQR